MESKQQEILDIAKTWIGTPFKYGACQKGRGVDCAKFIFLVFREAGILTGDMPPHVPAYWPDTKSEVVDKEIFRKQILKHADEIPLADRQVGDVLSFEWRGFECHLGIVVEDDHIIHARMRSKVVKQKVRSVRGLCRCYRWKGFN